MSCERSAGSSYGSAPKSICRSVRSEGADASSCGATAPVGAVIVPKPGDGGVGVGLGVGLELGVVSAVSAGSLVAFVDR